MVKVVYKERTPDRKAWNRYFVTIDGSTDHNELATLDFNDPVDSYNGNGRVELDPFKEEMYVLGYLMVTHPKESYPTVQMVVNFIPDEIKSKVYAIEWCHGFYDDFGATDFLKLEREGKWVTFVTLLTKENTGKDLPGVKLRFERPINLANDYEWERLARNWKGRL